MSSIGVALSQATGQSGSTNTTSATPVPTISEDEYKAATASTTVENLDKDGNQDKGQIVNFTCKILNFVRDSNGNTAGANVEASDSLSMSVIQIGFPSSTDLTQLNQGDILEVWGTDEGVFSGKNAFGAIVQEVVVTARYMTDTTTNYQTP